MSKIIELSGCNGVGKSTLYKQLEKHWDKNKNWIPGHYLYPKKKIDYNNLTSFLISIGKTLFQKNTNIDNNLLKETCERFVVQNPAFMDVFWELIAMRQRMSFNGMDVRYESISFLYTVIGRLQYLAEEKSNQIAIIDEGLIHQIGRMVYKFPDPVEVENEIKKLMDLIPLPDALIYLYAGVEENANRLKDRGHVTTIHKHLSSLELKEVTQQSQQRRILINTILESKGVPIFFVDSTNSIATNIQSIVSFCETLMLKS